jgi:hypothetical protein
MLAAKYTAEDLKKLPLRAIVAFAARCVRRIEHLALPPADHPENPRCRAAVGNAIRAAEDFARGLPGRAVDAVIREVEANRAAADGERVRESAMAAVVQAAHAAAAARHALDLRSEPGESHLVSPGPPSNPFAHLADITADLAALGAFTAAEEAADAVGHADGFIRGSVADYERLLRLDLGSYPQEGQPIDPSPDGPLGSLGPLGPEEPASSAQDLARP